MLKVSFIVPMFASCPDRRRNWLFVSKHISSIGNHERLVAEHGSNIGNQEGWTRFQFDTFHKTRMLNELAKHASGDVLVFADSDFVMPMGLWKSALKLMNRFDVVSPYSHISLLGPRQTINRTARGKFNWSMNVPEMRWGNLCGGVVMFRREAFEKCRGWDERFTHWGYEDIALNRVVRKLGLKWHIQKGITAHLWHQKTHRANGLQPSSQCYFGHYHGKTIHEIMANRC